jgi:hypothetical protein
VDARSALAPCLVAQWSRSWSKSLCAACPGDHPLSWPARETRALELAEQIPDRLADAVADLAVTELGSPHPAALLDVVADRVANCRRDTLN